MGIPRLYTHLSPHARPAVLEPNTQLFIDGPGLVHHVYQQCLFARPKQTSNPWDTAIPYIALGEATVKYLRMLESCGVKVSRIYFDGGLPASKRPTRISRMEDSLGKLRTYHSTHAHTLERALRRGGTDTAPKVFCENTVYTPCEIPLRAPPFIIMAAMDALVREYPDVISTVPGEAEGYAARDAIGVSGVVLTGDSDLLLFAGEGAWGVVMFKDLMVNFSQKRVSAMLFRPDEIAKELDVDLVLLGFLLLKDPNAGLSTLRLRCARIEERRKSGASIEELGKKWREFVAEYAFPIGTGGRVIDPKIAEIMLLREGPVGKEMFLPVLWEDPTRGSAWDTAKWVRALAYSLLFPEGEGMQEVCRRGQRITSTPVDLVSDREAELQMLLSLRTQPNWYVRLIISCIVQVFESHAQSLPHKSVLEDAICMLSSRRLAERIPQWTWGRIHIFAMVQAGWYSLLLLKEVLVATASKHVIDIPPVQVLDGRYFAEADPSAEDRGLVKTVLEEHHARMSASVENVENGKMTADAGKWQPEEEREGEWEEMKTKRTRKREKRGLANEGSTGGDVFRGSNMFGALAG